MSFEQIKEFFKAAEMWQKVVAGLIVAVIVGFASIIIKILLRRKWKIWIEPPDEKCRVLMRQVLFNNKLKNTCDYEVWFHCLYEKSDLEKSREIRKVWGPRDLLSGGWSGYLILKGAFDAIKPSGNHSIVNFGRCFTEGKKPPFEKKTKSKMALPPNMENNLYLLDAPIARSESMEAQPLNWIMQDILEKLRDKLFPPITVGMEIIDPSKPKDSELANKYPDEGKKLQYSAGEFRVASSVWDYGFIARAPNPYRKSAIVLMMAGLHAPATHAAAEVFSKATRLRQFDSYTKHKLMENDFFEAVFRIHKTYRQDELGKIEWLYFRQLFERE